MAVQVALETGDALDRGARCRRRRGHRRQRSTAGRVVDKTDDSFIEQGHQQGKKKKEKDVVVLDLDDSTSNSAVKIDGDFSRSLDLFVVVEDV